MRPARKRRGRPRLRWLLAAGIAATIAWSAGFLGFVEHIPRNLPVLAMGVDAKRYDAIVVLTGGSGRLEAGLRLLEAGRARKMFVSGVYHGVDVASLLELSQTAPRDLDCCITLGYSADDTTGNAAETVKWMSAEGFSSMLLVTANYHLPRSLLEFRSAMPGAKIAAWPVQPPNVQIANWWRWPGTARLLAGEYTKYLAAWVRARLRGLRTGNLPAWQS